MYLVETTDKLLWRRHVDQSKKRALPPVAVSQAVAREPIGLLSGEGRSMCASVISFPYLHFIYVTSLPF